jgi:fructose-1,6-bisphosphatase/inositol monophosphatase family enzyme
VDDGALMAALRSAADAIASELAGLHDWGLAGTRPGQYRSDLAADRAGVEVLLEAGLGVLSEESGLHEGDRSLVAVLDPLDGSTNASRGLPWYATSLCAVDAEGARAAVVVNLANGTRFEARRGAGATCDGEPISPSSCRSLRDAVVGLSGFPPRRLGWKQYRALGACALDLCAVASGALDGYVDCSRGAHGAWDYLGGMLVCTEAGALVADAERRGLVTLGHDERRTPLAASTPRLLGELLDARASF